MSAQTATFTAQGDILTVGSPVLLSLGSVATFNSLGGDVGTSESPIGVGNVSMAWVGAGSDLTGAAYFTSQVSSTLKSSNKKTRNTDPSFQLLPNPPCLIVYDGVVVKDCGYVPPVAPSNTPILIPIIGVPGFYSWYYTLADEIFFESGFIDESFFESKEAPVTGLPQP
jgi:hypothetical protein